MVKVFFVVLVSWFTCTSALANVWQIQCSGCHNGSMAPNVKQLKAKFPSKEKFIKAAMESNSPMMSPFKNNKESVQKAANELYK